MKKLVRIKVIALVEANNMGNNARWFTPSYEHNLLKLLCENMRKVEAEITADANDNKIASAEVIEAVEEK